MRAVNLLPRDLQQRKSFREEDPAVVIGSALGVIVMIALAGAFLVAHGKANTQQTRLTKAQLELAALSEKHRERRSPRSPPPRSRRSFRRRPSPARRRAGSRPSAPTCRSESRAIACCATSRSSFQMT